MTLDRSKFIATFTAEAEGYLTALDQGIVKLESRPNDAELLHELFRVAHTLKGAARMMGFNQMRDVSHKIEDLFGLLDEKKLVFNSVMADAVFAALDLIKKAINNIRTIGDEQVEIEGVVAKLVKSQELGSELLVSEDVRETLARQEETERAQIAKTVEKIESVVEASKPPSGTSEMPAQKVVKAPVSEEPAKQFKASTEEYIRVPVSRINRLLNLIGEMVINKVRASYRVGSFKKLNDKIRSSERMMFEFESHLKETLDIPDELIHYKGSFVRASQELEKEALLLSRLHQIESMFSGLRKDMMDVFDDVQMESFHFAPIIEELQQKMKEIRMLPCATLFEGFPRMIRDIAHEQKKDVNFVVIGEETELDKKVLEAIKGPLIHILRNAVDHGVESKEEREKSGKDAVGTVTLNAFQEKGSVIIEVTDDGKGIDLERVSAVAIQKGLISASELSDMTQSEILNLIYAEGFSTSPMITDVSGRGVGLDVVRKELEKLKGSVEIHSEKGKGATVRMTLPLTIAIMRVLLVDAAGVRWAIPLSDVEESLHALWEDVSTIENRMIIQVRGESVPVVPLSDVLGVHSGGAAKSKEKNSEFYVVITSSLKKRVGFVVDKIVGEEEIFIKNVGRHLGKIQGVSGATILASGEIVVIMDVPDLIMKAQMAHPAVESRLKKKTTVRKKRLMVVEDSLTTRELEKTILESNGYDVDVAIDGLDALDKLAKTQIDLIVTDINMPRMDGFELCRNIKTNDKLKNIPVVFVTALSREEEKRKGIDVGGQAYILKSQFDQGNLLDTIERLL